MYIMYMSFVGFQKVSPLKLQDSKSKSPDLERMATKLQTQRQIGILQEFLGDVLAEPRLEFRRIQVASREIRAETLNSPEIFSEKSSIHQHPSPLSKNSGNPETPHPTDIPRPADITATLPRSDLTRKTPRMTQNEPTTKKGREKSALYYVFIYIYILSIYYLCKYTSVLFTSHLPFA